jgi:hypothetical protein
MRRLSSLMNTTALAFAAVTAGIMLGAMPSAPAAAATASPPPAAGHWGNARKVPGMAALNPAGNGAIQSISCFAPGECAAGGFTVGDSVTHDHLFHDVITVEQAGTWGQARRLYTGQDGTSSVVNSVSCAVSGCTAGGWFTAPASANEQAFVVSAANGVPGTPLEVPGTPLTSGGAAAVLSVSCADAGDCAAGGHSVSSDGFGQPFVTDETAGSWGAAQPLGNMDALNKGGRGVVSAMSCGSAGDCVATGTYLDSQLTTHAFEAEEANGSWGPAQPLPGMDLLTTKTSEPTSVSCASPGNCVIAGFYATSDLKQQQAFVVDEHRGFWAAAQQLPATANRNTNGNAAVNSVSCGSAGECAAVGFYSTPDGRHQFLAEERGGSWQPMIRDLSIKGAGGGGFGLEANAVSCASPGNCVVTGEYNDANNNLLLFVVSQVGGSWGKAHELPGDTTLSKKKFGRLLTVSCATPGNCAAGGFYEDANSHLQGLVADESTATKTRLSLSATAVRYGHEQAEKISVKVIPRTGGTPGRQVTVATANRVLCVITLAGGTGGCTLAAKRLGPGTYAVLARYGGSKTYAGSVSGIQTLVVGK